MERESIVDRCEVLNSGVTPDAVVEHLDILKHDPPCVITGFKPIVMQAFSLGCAKEALHGPRPVASLGYPVEAGHVDARP